MVAVKTNRNSEFIKNTIILFIGKFATQFISLILLPLYTHYLITEDYGIVDLLQTYITLFVPILTLKVDSAIFRFLVDKRDDKEKTNSIITNILLISFVGSITAVLLCLLLNLFIEIKYFKYVLLNLCILLISNVLLQLLRGLGKTIHYSIASIIAGSCTLIINIILIICFKFGANSILISSSISNLIIIIYIIIITKLHKRIKISNINREQIKEILNYSIPMIPNQLSWWIVSVSDRTIISTFIDVAANGIYTVSCKFSNLLNSVFSIFNMSWQESATLHIDDEDRDEFFNNMINKLFMLFSSFSLIILVTLPLVFSFVIGSDYSEAYNYIPILLYSNSWNVLICLIGGIYLAKKKSKEVANTTLLSAFLNIIINLFLIKIIGLYAACISTLLSYFIMSMYRYIDCKKYVNLKLDFISIIFFSLFFFISSYIYIINIPILNIINFIVTIIYCIILNKYMIKSIILTMKNKLKRG